MKLACYRPDIPQNMGSLVRVSACLGLELHVVEPCGFVWDERQLKRTMMDYLALARITRHVNFAAFTQHVQAQGGRIVLLTTKASTPYTQCRYQSDDFLLLGRESAGVPPDVHERADLRVTIPMQTGARSLNVVNAASMVAGEALRQTRWGGKI